VTKAKKMSRLTNVRCTFLKIWEGGECVWYYKFFLALVSGFVPNWIFYPWFSMIVFYPWFSMIVFYPWFSILVNECHKKLKVTIFHMFVSPNKFAIQQSRVPFQKMSSLFMKYYCWIPSSISICVKKSSQNNMCLWWIYEWFKNNVFWELSLLCPVCAHYFVHICLST